METDRQGLLFRRPHGKPTQGGLYVNTNATKMDVEI